VQSVGYNISYRGDPFSLADPAEAVSLAEEVYLDTPHGIYLISIAITMGQN
jgi:hypothetical protein